MRRFALLLVIAMIASTLLAITFAPGIAFAATGSGTGDTPATGGTSATPAADQSASSSSSSSGSTSSSTTSTGSKTGAEVILFGLGGAALIGSGFYLTRKARA